MQDISKMDTFAIVRYLRSERHCAIACWVIDDVLTLDPNLTEEEAGDIIAEIDDDQDCSIGITWEVLQEYVDDYRREKEESLTTIAFD